MQYKKVNSLVLSWSQNLRNFMILDRLERMFRWERLFTFEVIFSLHSPFFLATRIVLTRLIFMITIYMVKLTWNQSHLEPKSFRWISFSLVRDFSKLVLKQPERKQPLFSRLYKHCKKRVPLSIPHLEYWFWITCKRIVQLIMNSIPF